MQEEQRLMEGGVKCSLQKSILHKTIAIETEQAAAKLGNNRAWNSID